MILFFDKNTGATLPKALKSLNPPFQIEIFQDHFDKDEDDDVWLSVVGSKNWLVIGHDHYDKNEAEKEAIRKYKIGYFRMWGGKEVKWEKALLFFKAYKQIAEKGTNTPKPFYYRVKKNGNLKSFKLP